MSEDEITLELRQLIGAIKNGKDRRKNNIVFEANVVESDIQALERNIRFIPKRKRNIPLSSKRIRSSKCQNYRAKRRARRL